MNWLNWEQVAVDFVNNNSQAVGFTAWMFLFLALGFCWGYFWNEFKSKPSSSTGGKK